MKKLQITSILLPLIFLSLCFSNCAGSRTSKSDVIFDPNPPFTIKEAYFQKWMAGIKEGGSGIEINLNFSAIDPNVVIKDIYFRNQILECRRSVANSNKYVANYSTISKNDVVMDIDPLKEAQNTPLKQFPFQLEEKEAVVSYLYKGKINYYRISKLSEKEQVAYPQSNPTQKN